MKKIIFILLIMLAGFTAQAQEKKKAAKYEVEVKGNCEQCKRRIEKAAYSVKGVKSAEWHEDDQMLHLIIDENKCNADDVRTAVAKSGHDTDKVKATDAAYNDLHSCCQYKRS